MFPRQEGDSDRIGFDMVFLMLGMFLFITIILIHFIGEKAELEKDQNQGNLIVQMFWPDTFSSDVDLWIQVNDNPPVGYSNLGGPIFNLLRDDLGEVHDTSGRNMEIAASRGLPDGEYIINVHLYTLRNNEKPIPVRVVVSLKKDRNSKSLERFTTLVELSFRSQEHTAVRFIVENGEIIDDSATQEYFPIRGVLYE